MRDEEWKKKDVFVRIKIASFLNDNLRRLFTVPDQTAYDFWTLIQNRYASITEEEDKTLMFRLDSMNFEASNNINTYVNRFLNIKQRLATRKLLPSDEWLVYFFLKGLSYSGRQLELAAKSNKWKLEDVVKNANVYVKNFKQENLMNSAVTNKVNRNQQKYSSNYQHNRNQQNGRNSQFVNRNQQNSQNNNNRNHQNNQNNQQNYQNNQQNNQQNQHFNRSNQNNQNLQSDSNQQFSSRLQKPDIYASSVMVNAVLNKNDRNTWYLDSWSNLHICNNKKMFVSMSASSEKIRFPDGSVVQCS